MCVLKDRVVVLKGGFNGLVQTEEGGVFSLSGGAS